MTKLAIELMNDAFEKGAKVTYEDFLSFMESTDQRLATDDDVINAAYFIVQQVINPILFWLP